jgi:pimeloyl-ACP methyl ester carboxylesterase
MASLIAMPSAEISSTDSSIHIEYEVLGDSKAPPVLLVMGFTAQMIAWPDRFCELLVDHGFQVIRFDNRDCGLSTKLHGVEVDPGVVMAAQLTGGEIPQVPYTLSHMAADAVGLLDVLGFDDAHIVGASMGGMIVQTMAIEHPHRVRSLTSIMSMTGEMEFGSPTPEAGAVLLAPPPPDRDSFIANSVAARVWQSRRYFDETRVKTEAARSYDRSFYPEGAGRQLAAIYASGSRAEGLQQLQTPTLVIHGTDDTLLQPDGGQRTAELVPNSTLMMVADMGHDLPEPLLPMITGAIASHAALADRNSGLQR